MMIATAHHLSSEQLSLLNRGPTYVPLGQLHVSSSSLSLDQIVAKQLAPLQRQLTSLFSKYPINPVQRMQFDEKLKQLFHQSFSTPLPPSIEQRAVYENELVQSIRHQLKKEHLILRRTADHNNVFYLGCAKDFEQKANEYMNKTTSYAMIGTIDQNHPQQPHLAEMIQSIDSILEDLHQKKRINKDHLAKMRVKKSKVTLPYLYFLPEPVQNQHVSLQPMMSSSTHSPIQPLAHYLDELLRPLYETCAQSTTLFNGADLMARLIDYEKKALVPRTRFVTFKIQNVYQMLSHDRIIQALNRFLFDTSFMGPRYNLSSETIQQLTEMVLRNNVFTYQSHLYRHVKGSPLSLPLTRTLANIYLRDWQMSFVDKLLANDEFYGRYHDMAILSWNLPIENLQALFNKLDQQHPDIRILTNIESSVHFLGLHIENKYNRLDTRVYHEPTLQPYVLPYVIGHPRLIYRRWFRWALMRAVRYCRLVEDFDEERLYIELTLLVNGYSLDFVKSAMIQVFTKDFAITLESIHDRGVYESLRGRLLRSIGQEKEEHAQQQQLPASKHRWVHLHYLYDWGRRCQFNEDFKKLWSDSFKNDPLLTKADLKPTLNTIHCYPLNALLTEQAPRRQTIAELPRET